MALNYNLASGGTVGRSVRPKSKLGNAMDDYQPAPAGSQLMADRLGVASDMRAAGRDGVTSDTLGRAKQLGISPQRAAAFRASLPTVAETKAAIPAATAAAPAKPASAPSPATYANSPARRVAPADRGDSINAPMQPVPAGGKTSWRAMPSSSLVNPSGKAIPGILAPDQQSGAVKINRLTGKPFGWRPGDPEPTGEQMQAARTGAVPPMIAKVPDSSPAVSKAPAKAAPAAAPAAPVAASKTVPAAVAKPPGSAGAVGQPGAKAASPDSPLAAAWRQPVVPSVQPAANIAEAAGFKPPARKAAPLTAKPPIPDAPSYLTPQDRADALTKKANDEYRAKAATEDATYQATRAARRRELSDQDARNAIATKKRLAAIEADQTLPDFLHDRGSLAGNLLRAYQRAMAR